MCIGLPFTIIAVISVLFNSNPAAASYMNCVFSTETLGNHTVPPLGCKLSQMITVNGAMNVSGVEGELPLRELAAMGGTPDASNPKRHFIVPADKQLYLAYLKLTDGAVITNSVSGGAGIGGSILVDNNSVLRIIGSIFKGGTLAAYYGACIGALSGTSGAIISVVRTTFESNTAGHGGAFWIDGASTVLLEDSKFISNTAQAGAGGAIACGSRCTVKLVGGNNIFDRNQDEGNRATDSFYASPGGIIDFDTCRPGTFLAANPLSNVNVDQDFYGCLYSCPAGKTTANFPEYVVRKGNDQGNDQTFRVSIWPRPTNPGRLTNVEVAIGDDASTGGLSNARCGALITSPVNGENVVECSMFRSTAPKYLFLWINGTGTLNINEVVLEINGVEIAGGVATQSYSSYDDHLGWVASNVRDGDLGTGQHSAIQMVNPWWRLELPSTVAAQWQALQWCSDDCPAGYYCPGTTGGTLQCSAGMYSIVGASSCEYTPTTCPAGTYASGTSACLDIPPPKSVEVRVAGDDALSVAIAPPYDATAAGVTKYQVAAFPTSCCDKDIVTRNGIFDYARLDLIDSTSSSYNEISMCFWMKDSGASARSKNEGMVSWATAGGENEANAFVVGLGYVGHTQGIDGKLYVHHHPSDIVQGLPADPGDVNDGNWHHVCLAVKESGALGVCFVQIDNEINNATCPNSFSIPKAGTIVLGNDQDSVGGGFTAAEAFVGRISRLRIYSQALDPAKLVRGDQSLADSTIALLSSFTLKGAAAFEASDLYIVPGNAVEIAVLSADVAASSSGITVADADKTKYTVSVKSCDVGGGCSTDFATDATTVPDKPNYVEVRVAGDDALSIAIEPPDDDGGANITHYKLVKKVWPTTAFLQDNGLAKVEQVAATRLDNNAPFTLEMWFRATITCSPNQFGNCGWLLLKNCVCGILWQGPNKPLKFYDSSYNTGIRSDFQIGTWYHVEMVNTGTNVLVYYDGGKFMETHPSHNDGQGSTSCVAGFPIYIGHWFQNSEFFTGGNLADIRVWNTARTAIQLNENFQKDINTETAVLNEGLVGRWAFRSSLI